MKMKWTYAVILSFFAANIVCAANSQVADPLGSVSTGINNQMKNDAEMNRVFDEQDKKTKQIRSYFNNAFADAQDFIVAGKFDKAQKPLAKLHSIENLNIYEAARLHLIDSWYFGQTGEQAKETAALLKLMPIGAETIEPNAFVAAGMRLLKRQYNTKDYAGAIDTLAQLRKCPESGTELASILPALTKLDELAVGTQAISSQITADEEGHWGSSLLRPSFYLDKITGRVISIDFDCLNKKLNIPYTPDSVINAPAAWGACKIQINSTPGASYSLIQSAVAPAV